MNLLEELDLLVRPQGHQPRNGFVSVGSVRGWDGKVYRSARRATEATEADQRACRKVGGYSDRLVCRIEDGRVTYKVTYVED